MRVFCAAMLCLAVFSGCYMGDPLVPGSTRARVSTSLGEFVIELDETLAPLTVANFVQYADEGFYDGTLFHRVVPDFVIQGGGYLPGLEPRPTHDPFPLESGNGLRNLRGAVGMARGSEADSATSQFYVNLSDNLALDATLDQRGYTVFGVVIEGMEVVDAIAAVATQSASGFDDVPVDNVVVLGVTVELGPDTVSPEWQYYAATVRFNFLNLLRDTAISTFPRLLSN